MANRLSLLQYFDAPEHHRGIFGWMCGYSADALFLNEAVERFTRETQGQRAARGTLSMALMLDPSHPAIGPVEVPGLAHLPLRRIKDQRFRLLHAKVALLGFRNETKVGGWLIRLIVSTGNWTRQTLEESLDLAWCIEVASNELDDEDDDLAIRCADLGAAWSLFRFLLGLFDLRLLDASHHHDGGETRLARDELASWLTACAQRSGDHSPRFIDNRERSLLDQLSEAIKRQAGGGTRNYLAMGSGFFESAPAKGAEGSVPRVLDEIVSRLTSQALLTKRAEIDVFVNPVACQAVALAQDALRERTWTLRPPSRMEHLFGPHAQRSLHAKFLFSASERSNSDICHRPWVYLGSGNLTGPGFMQAMSRHTGNLEAGVVFGPNGLQWRGVDHERLVTHYLPLQWETEIASATALLAGNDMPDRETVFVSPPIAWLVWQPDTEDSGYLTMPAEPLVDGEVLDQDGRPCARCNHGFVWLGKRPRQVRLRWIADDGAQECLIPIMDEFGRLAATPLSELGFDEVWWSLVSFPAAIEEEADAEEADSAAAAPTGGKSRRAGADGGRGAAPYPVRQMMDLLEQIAARQTEIFPADWPAWCTRLEQTLSRVAESPVVAYFRSLGLNPLSPLRVPAFRPNFAEDATGPEGQLYEAMLDRIEAQWKTGDLAMIGETA